MAVSRLGGFSFPRKVQQCLVSSRICGPREFIEFGTSFSTYKAACTAFKSNIVIPQRIKRSDTAILEALASTVSKDYTAPHYKFHDDPYFIPSSNTAKRAFALSKESGRKAAKWIREEYRECFRFSLADPHIEAFMPNEVFTEDDEPSLEVLQRFIKQVQVTTSLKIYEDLKSKGIEVDLATKQSLLELLCFYNCEDPPEPEFIEERWFRQQISRNRRISSQFSSADKLFREIKPENARSHATMLRSLAKYNQTDRAWNLYTEMQEKQMPVDVVTYNSLLCITCYLKEGAESRWELTEQILTSMHREGVKPNVGTLNGVLETVMRLGTWRDSKKLALRIMAEMKQLGIEPSLGSYYYLLIIFCRERGPVSTILYDIVKLLKHQKFQIQHPKDIFFFVTAMDVCHNHLQDKELAYQVHDLLHDGKNYALLGDALKEAVYYQHLFKLLCATETIDIFFEFYHKLVPHVYTPEPSVMLDIIRMVEMNGALHFVPKIWSDMVVFEHTMRENLLDELLSIIATNTPGEELQQQFLNIATSIQTKIDEQLASGRRVSVQWTGPMLGKVMVVFLNSGEYEKARDVMEKSDVEQNKVAGTLWVDQIQHFVRAAIEQQDCKSAIMAVNYAMNIGYVEAGTMAQEILEKITVATEEQRQTLKEVASGVILEKPEVSP